MEIEVETASFIGVAVVVVQAGLVVILLALPVVQAALVFIAVFLAR